MRPQKEIRRALSRLFRCKALRRHHIEVVWKNIRKGAAEVGFYEDRFIIGLSRRRITTALELEDAMIHECAHILAWGNSNHGRAWGIEVARLYRAYHRVR